MVIVILSSCSVPKSEDSSTSETEYAFLSADWAYYADTKELLERANIVYIGRITGISFAMLDNNALPVTEKQDVQLHWFRTIYDVEVLSLYKGEVAENTQFRVMGGIKGYREEEQRNLLDKYNLISPEQGLPIWDPAQENYTGYKIGETYLFVLHQFETGIPTILNFEQSSFDLHNPFIGSNNLSAKDIISNFGQEKWDSYWEQWKVENPEWETWIDKEMAKEL